MAFRLTKGENALHLVTGRHITEKATEDRSDDGLRASTDPKRVVRTVRRVLEGQRRRVLHLHTHLLHNRPDQPDHEEGNTEKTSSSGGRVEENSPPDPTTNPTRRLDQPDEVRRIYAALGESEDARQTRRLIEFVRSHGGRMTARRLHLSNKTRYPTVEAAEAALGELVEAQLADWDQPVNPKRGRPSHAIILKPETTYLRFSRVRGDFG